MKTTLLTHALSMLMLLLPAPASAKDKVYLRDMRLTPNIGEGIVVANLDMTSSKKKASKAKPMRLPSGSIKKFSSSSLLYRLITIADLQMSPIIANT